MCPKAFEGKVCMAFALYCLSGDGRIIVVVEVYIHNNSVKIKLRGRGKAEVKQLRSASQRTSCNLCNKFTFLRNTLDRWIFGFAA